MADQIRLVVSEIVPGQECFVYQGQSWTWRKTSTGLHAVGSDRKGLWGDFTNGQETTRLYRGDLVEELGREAASQIFRRKPFPNKCFVYVVSTDEIGVITRGEKGYLPAAVKPAKGLDKRQTVELLNEALGVTKDHAAAMNAGALFGWDCPGARHTNYDKDGKPRSIEWKKIQKQPST